MDRNEVIADLARALAKEPLPQDLRRLVTGHQKVTALDAAQLAWGAAVLKLLSLGDDTVVAHPGIEAYDGLRGRIQRACEYVRHDGALVGTELSIWGKEAGVSLRLHDSAARGHLECLVRWTDMAPEKPNLFIEHIDNMASELKALRQPGDRK